VVGWHGRTEERENRREKWMAEQIAADVKTDCGVSKLGNSNSFSFCRVYDTRLKLEMI
jgi:hypothetical protein